VSLRLARDTIMNFQFPFAILVLITLLTALYGIYRYRTPFNPLTFFSGFQIGLITLVSGWVAYGNLETAPYSETDMIYTVFLSGVYLLGVTSAYFIRVGLLINVFGSIMILFGLNYASIASRFSRFKFLTLNPGTRSINSGYKYLCNMDFIHK